MSIPPQQQPGPQQPNPYQQNPYLQQPPGPVPPSPYAQPPAPAGQPPAFPPQGPPPAAKRPVPPWVWGLGGAVVASAVWAGVLFAGGTLGGGDDEADLAGYHVQKNLCDAVTIDAFKERYESRLGSDPNSHYASRQQGLDVNNCNWSLKDKNASASDYSSVFVNSTAQWHKKSEPEGEFASLYKGFEDRSQGAYAYETKSVDGFGDEAFLVVEKRSSTGSKTGPKEFGGMTLAVRDGWFTFELQWSWYGSSTSGSSKAPSEQEVEKMIKSDARDALAALKKS
ncbi:hypothetical protein [Streptomyces sp. AN091965]|uniref:hypothetical protein n=1 Tax=Streptomyces sp. AN091965 TaxID=2927803 RepID=UPI001F610A21|nr:hypothetical protein [Streptomyces sp. AN091965]MCI3933428.1 hypothetical protein [Streptomyces sp. AN091965]